MAERDLQPPCQGFFPQPPRPPSFIDMGNPHLFVFPAQFPLSLEFLFSGLLCLVVRFVPNFRRILFLCLLLVRQLNLSYSVNLSCSFSAFILAVAYPHLSPFLSLPTLFVILTKSSHYTCHFPSNGALYRSCLSISAVGTQF